MLSYTPYCVLQCYSTIHLIISSFVSPGVLWLLSFRKYCYLEIVLKFIKFSRVWSNWPILSDWLIDWLIDWFFASTNACIVTWLTGYFCSLIFIWLSYTEKSSPTAETNRRWRKGPNRSTRRREYRFTIHVKALNYSMWWASYISFRFLLLFIIRLQFIEHQKHWINRCFVRFSWVPVARRCRYFYICALQFATSSNKVGVRSSQHFRCSRYWRSTPWF